MAFHGRLDADDVGECHALKDVLDAECHEKDFGSGKPLHPARIASAHAEARLIVIGAADQRRHGVVFARISSWRMDFLLHVSSWWMGFCYCLVGYSGRNGWDRDSTRLSGDVSATALAAETPAEFQCRNRISSVCLPLSLA